MHSSRHVLESKLNSLKYCLPILIIKETDFPVPEVTFQGDNVFLNLVNVSCQNTAQDRCLTTRKIDMKSTNVFLSFYDRRLPHTSSHARGSRYKILAEPISLSAVVLVVSKMRSRIGEVVGTAPQVNHSCLGWVRS